jgi:hypothetical protein
MTAIGNHECFLQNIALFGQVVSEEQIFRKSTNQKQELLMVTMFVQMN